MPSIELPERPRNRRERRQQLRAADSKDGEDQSSDDETPPTSTKPASFRAEDIGLFNPRFQAEPEHGRITPGPVVNAGKHVYYLNVFVFVDRLKELARRHGAAKVIKLIPSCLQGTVATMLSRNKTSTAVGRWMNGIWIGLIDIIEVIVLPCARS